MNCVFPGSPSLGIVLADLLSNSEEITRIGYTVAMVMIPVYNSCQPILKEII